MRLPMLYRLAEDLRRMTMAASPFYELQPWNVYRTSPLHQFERWQREAMNTTAAIPKIGKEGFQVSVDVTNYQPNELLVKVVDNDVVVEGKYENQEDDAVGGYVSRHFVHRYPLPKGYDADKVMSTLSSDGVLTVSVPKPPALEDKSSNERTIPIQQTGPAHLNVKENTPIEDESSKATNEAAATAAKEKK